MSVELTNMFVSSTADLDAERKAIREVLNEEHLERMISPYISDLDYRPGDAPERRILQEIRRSEIFVCLMGHRYGTPHPRAKKGVPSMCDWEFRKARRRWTVDVIPLLKVVPAPSVEPLQANFRQRVRDFRNGKWGAASSEFSNTDELKENLKAAIRGWMYRKAEGQRKIFAVGASMLLMGFGGGAAVPLLTESISAGAFAGIGTLLASVLPILGLILLWHEFH